MSFLYRVKFDGVPNNICKQIAVCNFITQIQQKSVSFLSGLSNEKCLIYR